LEEFVGAAVEVVEELLLKGLQRAQQLTGRRTVKLEK
jgi:hypothetical protein